MAQPSPPPANRTSGEQFYINRANKHDQKIPWNFPSVTPTASPWRHYVFHLVCHWITLGAAIIRVVTTDTRSLVARFMWQGTPANKQSSSVRLLCELPQCKSCIASQPFQWLWPQPASDSTQLPERLWATATQLPHFGIPDPESRNLCEILNICFKLLSVLSMQQ